MWRAATGRIKLYNLIGRLNGGATTLVLVYLQTGANALNTMTAVRQEMASAAPSFPADVTWTVPFDTTTFISDSIRRSFIPCSKRSYW